MDGTARMAGRPTASLTSAHIATTLAICSCLGAAGRSRHGFLGSRILLRHVQGQPAKGDEFYDFSRAWS